MRLRKLYRQLRDSVHQVRARVVALEVKVAGQESPYICADCGVYHSKGSSKKVKKTVWGYRVTTTYQQYCSWCAPEYDEIEQAIMLGVGGIADGVKYFKSVDATRVEVEGP